LTQTRHQVVVRSEETASSSRDAKTPVEADGVLVSETPSPEGLVGSRRRGRRDAIRAKACINPVQYNRMRQCDADDGTRQTDTLQHYPLLRKSEAVLPAAHCKWRSEKSHGLGAQIALRLHCGGD
jgi:hypothetical protein